MPLFFGSNSSYLRNNSLKYFAFAVVLPVVFLGAIYGIVKIFTGTQSVLYTMGILLVLVAVIKPLTDFFNKKSGQFGKGRSGENSVRKVLEELPGSYSVFQGVVLDKHWGDIDFVIVGPTGIFTIEVKSHGGVIGFNGQELTVNTKQFSKNFLRQANGEAGALKRYFQKHLGLTMYIHSAIVFSHTFASVEIGSKMIERVYITEKNFLPSLLYSLPTFEYPLPREKIEELLKKTV